MLGDLTTGQIESVLHNLIVGRIGCHADGLTYVVPVTYAYDGHYVYGHTDEGLKIDLMRKNPNICFQVDSMENMGNWRSVIAWGEFEELKKLEERERGMRILMDRTLPFLTGETTIHHAMTDGHRKATKAMQGIVYRIKLTKKTGRFEKR